MHTYCICILGFFSIFLLFCCSIPHFSVSRRRWCTSCVPCAISLLNEFTAVDPIIATIPPLLITFKSGCCPKELFEDLGNCLVNKQVANSALTKDESECHNSQICFTMGLQKLLLKSNDNYIYIELILDEEDRKLSSNLCTLCNIVRKLIEQNITKACKTLGYSSNATYSLSFKCRCSQMEKFHSAELRTDDPLLNRISSCALILTKRQMSVQSVMHGFLR